jgi:NAD(P)-dependent dehydrogenase (short-subunit alcohol dehydrogenase family)
MSKAGLDMLTKSAAMEMAPWGIRVNGISPAFTEGTCLYSQAYTSKEELDALKARA